jgi:hypothetical protein
MPEITGVLTDDIGTITHLVTLDGQHLSVDELAQHLDNGDDYYVTFDEGKRYTITMVAEDGRLEPTVDDPDGVHTIWDLERGLDPEEEEIEGMFDEMTRMGEYDHEVEEPHKRDEESNPEELL